MWGDEEAGPERLDGLHAARSYGPCPTRPCPLCGAGQVITNHWARRVLGVVGALAGAACSGGHAWLSTSKPYGVRGEPAPPGVALHAIAAAALAALAGGSTGCAIGASLGDALDAQLTREFRCDSFGQTFNDSTRAAR